MFSYMCIAQEENYFQKYSILVSIVKSKSRKSISLEYNRSYAYKVKPFVFENIGLEVFYVLLR